MILSSRCTNSCPLVLSTVAVAGTSDEASCTEHLSESSPPHKTGQSLAQPSLTYRCRPAQNKNAHRNPPFSSKSQQNLSPSTLYVFGHSLTVSSQWLSAKQRVVHPWAAFSVTCFQNGLLPSTQCYERTKSIQCYEPSK